VSSLIVLARRSSAFGGKAEQPQPFVRHVRIDATADGECLGACRWHVGNQIPGRRLHASLSPYFGQHGGLMDAEMEIPLIELTT
jgi:hypothetical protein